MTYPRKGSRATRKSDGVVGAIYASDRHKDVLTVRWWTGSKFDTRVCTREALLKEWEVAEKPYSNFNFGQSLDRFTDHCGRMSKLCFDAAKSLAAMGIGILIIVFIYDVRHDAEPTSKSVAVTAEIQETPTSSKDMQPVKPYTAAEQAKNDRDWKRFNETAQSPRWIAAPHTKPDEVDEFYELPGETGENACAEVAYSPDIDSAYTVTVLNAKHEVRMSTRHMAEVAAVSVCGNGRHP